MRDQLKEDPKSLFNELAEAGEKFQGELKNELSERRAEYKENWNARVEKIKETFNSDKSDKKAA